MIETGLDILLLADSEILKKESKVGLLSHGAGVDGKLVHSSRRLVEKCGSGLVMLFGPEHGMRGEAQDMEPVERYVDRATGRQVVSLYGSDEDSLSPAREAFDELDVLVADLQDVGARYYTYVWTLVRCLDVAANAGVKVVVCDRPNPLGGVAIEGAGIETGYRSFVGGHDVSVRHGMTIGELCLMVKKERSIDVDLEVVPMKGWRRDMLFEDTALPWVLPSPNMPTRDTALVYPGGCLVEGTQLSEGRGTTRPFEIMGAEFIDPDRLVETLYRLDLPGVLFRPVYFQPTFQKSAGKICGGIQQHVTDPAAYKSLLTGVSFLWAVRKLWPDEFRWRTHPYEFVGSIPAVDLLTGSDRFRTMLENGASPMDISETWRAYEKEFSARREEFLLYR